MQMEALLWVEVIPGAIDREDNNTTWNGMST